MHRTSHRRHQQRTRGELGITVRPEDRPTTEEPIEVPHPLPGVVLKAQGGEAGAGVLMIEAAGQVHPTVEALTDHDFYQGVFN